MVDQNTYAGGYDLGAAGAANGAYNTAANAGYVGQPSATDTAQAVVDQVKQTTGDVVDQVKDTSGAVVNQVQEQAKSQITQQKDRVAQSIGGIALALRQTSQNMQNVDQAGVAQYVDTVAERFEQASSFLKDKDLPEIVEEIEDFAAREPVLFLGGAFALGLVAARFLKSSNPGSGPRPSRTRALALRPSNGRPLTDHDFDDAAQATPPYLRQSDYTPGSEM